MNFKIDTFQNKNVLKIVKTNNYNTNVHTQKNSQIYMGM